MTPPRRRTPQVKALALAKELDKGDWPEDLEPQEVAWLLRELVKGLPAQQPGEAPGPQAA